MNKMAKKYELSNEVRLPAVHQSPSPKRSPVQTFEEWRAAKQEEGTWWSVLHEEERVHKGTDPTGGLTSLFEDISVANRGGEGRFIPPGVTQDSSRPKHSFFGQLGKHYQHKLVPGEVPTDPSSAYLTACSELKLLPEPIVLHLSTDTGEVTLQHFGIGDNVAKAISRYLASSRKASTQAEAARGSRWNLQLKSTWSLVPIISLNLTCNRISDNGCSAIVSAVDASSLKLLDLSQVTQKPPFKYGQRTELWFVLNCGLYLRKY